MDLTWLTVVIRIEKEPEAVRSSVIASAASYHVAEGVAKGRKARTNKYKVESRIIGNLLDCPIFLGKFSHLTFFPYKNLRFAWKIIDAIGMSPKNMELCVYVKEFEGVLKFTIDFPRRISRAGGAALLAPPSSRCRSASAGLSCREGAALAGSWPRSLCTPIG